jgi:hypothetical protein
VDFDQPGGGLELAVDLGDEAFYLLGADAGVLAVSGLHPVQKDTEFGEAGPVRRTFAHHLVGVLDVELADRGGYPVEFVLNLLAGAEVAW